MAALCALLLVLFIPALSSAAETRIATGTVEPFSEPGAVAVDQGTNDLYVADYGEGKVERFDENGAPASFSALSSNEIGGFAFFSGEALEEIAVDSASHDFYVADYGNGVIKAFKADGEPHEFTTGPGSGTNELPQFTEVCGVAVDSNGDIYMGDYGTGVHVYAPDGEELTSFTASEACNVAVDSSGSVYVARYVLGEPGVAKFTPSEFPVTSSTTYASDGDVTSAATYALAVDPANDDLYVDTANRVKVFSSSGAVSYEFGSGITGSEGVAVDDATDRAYAADAGAGTVQVYGSLVPLPDATTEDPTEVGSETALLHGTVGAAGGPSTTCEFQYTTKAKFQSEGFTDAATAPCEPAGPFTGESQSAVSAEATGLTPGTDYRFRLAATNSYGTTFGAARAFHAPSAPPLVESESVETVGADNADLSAAIKPEGGPTTYRVEFGTTTAYGQSSESATVGSEGDESPHTVSVHVAGLAPGTAYHFRFLATNGAGTTHGEDTSFATYPAPQHFAPCSNDQYRSGFGAELPDCRAYEQATPTDKNGADVQGSEGMVEASSNGDRVTFYLAAGLPTTGGSSRLDAFLASRGPNGWSSDGLLPLTEPGEEIQTAGWSEDLSVALVGGLDGLLLRDSATGAFELQPTGDVNPQTAGFAADTRHFVFEVKESLLPEVPKSGGNELYDLDHGKLTYAGRTPAGSATSCDDEAGPACVASPSGSYAGASKFGLDLIARDAISRDGSKVFFSTPGASPSETKIYLREGGERTTWLSASQRTTPDPGGAKPATIQAIARDGSVAFFTSPSELTDDASTGLPASIATAASDGSGVDQSLIPTTANAVAADGSHVYWVNTAANKIGRANLDGTGVEENFIAGATKPQGIAVDGSHVYWTNAVSGANGAGTIGRANLDGTGVEQSFITGASNPRGIAVDGSHIYWVNAGTTIATHQIGRANLDGTSPNQSLIAVSGESPKSVALDSSHVYWTAEGIGRANLDGTSPNQSLVGANKAPSARGIAVDGSHIYWTSGFPDGLLRANLDGSGVEEHFIGAYQPEGLALTGNRIFWTNANSADLGNDLYAYRTPSGDLEDLTPDSAAVNPKGADVVGVLGASRDGSYVYFAANGVLAPGASAGNCGGEFPPRACNLYVAHGDTVTFVARLLGSVLGSGSVVDENNWAASAGRTARVASDGTLLFRSLNSLTGYDNVESTAEGCGNAEQKGDRCSEFFRYTPTSERLTCVTCSPAGLAPKGEASLVSTHMFGLFDPPGGAPLLSRNLSANGRRVFFESTDALLPTDTDGNRGCPRNAHGWPFCKDVYEWEAKGEGSCESESEDGGCLYLISSGKSPDPSYFLDASEDGDHAFFFTHQPLVPGDEDELQDIYDASVGGGLAAQHELTPPTCDTTACVANPPPPPPESLSSATFSGPGNAKAAAKKRRCPKGKRRARSAGKTRCVSRHSQKKKRHKRANVDRGGSQ